MSEVFSFASEYEWTFQTFFSGPRYDHIFPQDRNRSTLRKCNHGCHSTQHRTLNVTYRCTALLLRSPNAPGSLWRSWVWHSATSRQVSGSIPDGAIGIFHWHNPSARNLSLGLTQPLTEMSTRNISWGVKLVGAWGWQPYHIYVPTVLKCGSLNLLEPLGLVQACNWDCFNFYC